MRRSAANSKPRTALIRGHFGELLQGKVGGEIALVTLPCPQMWVRASWRPATGRFAFLQSQDYLPPRWLLPLYQALKGHPPAGSLVIAGRSRPGTGCGASTAALLAVTAALGRLDPALALTLEGASDPLAMRTPGTCLWASRRAEVLGRSAVPALQVVGGHIGPVQRTDPGDAHFAPIDDLAQRFLAGPGTSELAELATTSAERCAALRGTKGVTTLSRLARQTGALGYSVAHTGSARALLFAPGTADVPRTRALLREAGFSHTLAWRARAAL